MKSNRKQIIQKLLQSRLTLEEERRLLEDTHVQKEMASQWKDDAHFSFQDLMMKKRIWKGIRREIWKEKRAQRNLLYRVSGWVACFFLLIGFSVTLLPGRKKNNITQQSATWHVLESDIKKLDSLILPDGSQVQIGPNTRLEYPGSFTGEIRTVRLLGQAYFDVAPDPERPFIVETPDMNITALGTAFEVYNYGSGWLMETILTEGKVKVDIQLDESAPMISEILYPDQKIVMDRESRHVFKAVVDAGKYSSWSREHVLSFENESLALILPRLEQWYGCKVIYDKKKVENYRFTFKVRDESIERILFMFQATSSLAYTKNKKGEYELYEEP
ncbi:MAG: FecR domain-containing protein [Tannerellaceae bacterium]|nr:FecR domain-containing protein [Tannerellaceae bacterium]